MHQYRHWTYLVFHFIIASLQQRASLTQHTLHIFQQRIDMLLFGGAISLIAIMLRGRAQSQCCDGTVTLQVV